MNAPTGDIRVVALYKFTPIEDPAALQAELQSLCTQAGLHGTLLVAEEGLNGTVAGPSAGIQNLLDALQADGRFEGLSCKESWTDTPPFWRMKVRLKKEIVTMGVPGTDPARLNGTRVRGEEWNALLDDPEVVVIDTRNQYEVDVGSFPGAVSPNTQSFREFPAFADTQLDPRQHRKVAMFCTGGIRCEKSTHYLLSQGFAEVYHLDGGILQYLEDMQQKDNRWQGECFVFDGRVSVDKALQPGRHTQCHGCRHPLTPEERADPRFEEGICCPHCIDSLTAEKRARAAERHKQVLLAEARAEQHLGKSQS